MNNFSKNKGMIVELTSLLDVILILLFMVIMNTANQAEQVEKDAQDKVDKANEQVSQIKEETDSKLDEMSQYVSTIEGFENGELLSLCINNREGSDWLEFVRGGEEILSVPLDSSVDIKSQMRMVLNEISAKNENSLVLAAVIYDGETVYYRDTIAVRKALEEVRLDYENIYFTYINTSVN